MADFFLLIRIRLLSAQFSTILIAALSYLFDSPTIARSSAYAKTSRPLSSSFYRMSLNMIKNKVGDRTPPYMTPAPIGISLSFTLNAVCL